MIGSECTSCSELDTHTNNWSRDAYHNLTAQKYTCIFIIVIEGLELAHWGLQTLGWLWIGEETSDLRRRELSCYGNLYRTLWNLCFIMDSKLELYKSLSENLYNSNPINTKHSSVCNACMELISRPFSLWQIFFAAAAGYCYQLATHQHGCCILQSCIKYSTGELRAELLKQTAAYGHHLSMDAYG